MAKKDGNIKDIYESGFDQLLQRGVEGTPERKQILRHELPLQLFNSLPTSLIPFRDDTLDLGSASRRWKDGYFSGNITVSGLVGDEIISTTNLTDESVTTAKLDGDAVTSAKIADGAVLPEHLVAGTGTSWAWQSFTVTMNNFTVGNGTATGYYTQIGKTVVGTVHIDCGSSTAFGTASGFDLPVASAARYGSMRFAPLGNIMFHDSGSNVFVGMLYSDNSTSAAVFGVTEDAVYIRRRTTTASIPFTIANGDDISVSFSYEAA